MLYVGSLKCDRWCAQCLYCVSNACLISKGQTVIGMLRFLPLVLVDQGVQEAPRLQLNPLDPLGPACEEFTITTSISNRDIQMNTMMELLRVNIEWSTDATHKTWTVQQYNICMTHHTGSSLEGWPQVRCFLHLLEFQVSLVVPVNGITWFIHKSTEKFSFVVTLGPCSYNVLCIEQEGSHTAGPSLAGPCRAEGELEIKVVFQSSDFLLNAKLHIFWQSAPSNGAVKTLKVTAAVFEVCLCCCIF